MKTLAELRDEAELQALIQALTATGWNISQSALRLEVSRVTLYRLMDKHGLKRRVTGTAQARIADAPAIAGAAMENHL